MNFVTHEGIFKVTREAYKLAPTLGQEQWNLAMNGQFFRQRKPPKPPHPMGWKWAQVFASYKMR